MRKRAFWALILLTFLFTLAPTALADETETAPTEPEIEMTEIRTVEELKAMAEDPLGSYILMEDLDLSGVEWKPIDFKGTFDGNGHAILNLTLTQPGGETGLSYDGNEDSYSTSFVGLFGILRDAQVKNLRLINVRSFMEVDYPCFLGGIAGYCDSSTITDCTVTGTLELRAFQDIYGVGGVAGYGVGSVERCKVDVTLITVDTDPDTKAEQFLGGVYATGFIDSKDNEVTIDGYVSEHGYVHSGGIVGMYMQMPLGRGISGRITGNSVTGQITFFEHNSDRRAYCASYAGEVLAATYIRNANKESFTRKEIWNDYTELRPCMCAEPEYTETVVAPTCDAYGYTSFECVGCGDTYTDNYTLHVHTVTSWTVAVEPTTEAEGLSIGYCDNCGAESRRTEPKLEPVPTETTEPPATEPVVEEKPYVQINWQLPVMAAGFLFLLAAAMLLGKKNKVKKEV